MVSFALPYCMLQSVNAIITFFTLFNAAQCDKKRTPNPFPAFRGWGLGMRLDLSFPPPPSLPRERVNDGTYLTRALLNVIHKGGWCSVRNLAISCGLHAGQDWHNKCTHGGACTPCGKTSPCNSLERETVHWRSPSFWHQVSSKNIYPQAAWCLWRLYHSRKELRFLSVKMHVYRNGLKWQGALFTG